MKVVNLSFQRCGTSSFNHFMIRNGYRGLHSSKESSQRFKPKGKYLKDVLHEINNMKPLDNLLKQYQAFSDNPWMMFYEYIESNYPNVKFILVLRDSKEWISSMIRIMGGVCPSYWEPILYNTNGDVIFNEKNALKVYETHIKNVIQYFEGKKDKLLVLQLSEDNKILTQKIEKFLNFKSKIVLGERNKTTAPKKSKHITYDDDKNPVNHWIGKLNNHKYNIPPPFRNMPSHMGSVKRYIKKGITYNVNETLESLREDINRVNNTITDTYNYYHEK